MNKHLFLPALLLVLAGTLRADLIAYEGFSYDVVEGMKHLNSLTPTPDAPYPAVGWKGPLSHNYQGGKDDPASTLLAGSLTYNGLVSNGNRAKFLRGITCTFKEPIGAEPGTIWMSMLLQSTASKYSESVYLKSSSPAATRVTINNAYGKSKITIDGANTASSVNKNLHLYLLRIDFTPSGNTLYFWFNPNLSSEPALSTASFTKTYSTPWSFDQIEMGSGTAGDRYTIADEIRVGTTFLSVTRSSSLPGGTILLLH